MLGHRRPLSSIAPAKIMAVAVTKVKPKAASIPPVSVSNHALHRKLMICERGFVQRMSGTSELAMEGAARTLWKTAMDRSPRIGFVVWDM